MNEVEIIRQESIDTYGNDCLIRNCYVVLKCFDKFFSLHIQNTIGWGQNETEFVKKRQFDNEDDAIRYYECELRDAI